MVRASHRGGTRPAEKRFFTGRILCTALGFAFALGGHAGPAVAGSPGLVLLRVEHGDLLRRLDRLGPQTPYLVVDTRQNRVLLRDREHAVLREATCASGAARRFEGPKPKHRWDFATPKGRFAILRKVADPLWTKPEWFFVETGEEIPIFAEDRRRFQRGVLGEYALYFAKEYMIHGTLYEVNLGKSITHGCVRVGAADLQYFYDTVDVGWPVHIY